MDHLHRRFSDEQVKVLLQSYCQRKITRSDLQEMLGIENSRFSFDDPRWLEPEAHAMAKSREEFAEFGPCCFHARPMGAETVLDQVSVTTIIDRAKKLKCHIPRRKRKSHDREVLTASIGALIQHDASHHLWSPFAQKKWALVTFIDDYSRKILFADFFPKETTWAHIQANQRLIQTYGLPLRYYVDSLRVFRFVQGRDSF